MHPSAFTPLSRRIACAVAFAAASPAAIHACLQGHEFKPLPPLKAEELLAGRVAFPPLKPVRPESLVVRPAIPLPRVELPTPVSHPAEPVANLSAFTDYVRRHESRAANERTFEQQTDYAVALIHLGRTADAIKVLAGQEQRRPGLYATAVNLGTAYELAGNLEKAAAWIAEGMERNPAGHAGTEWLHLALLKARIQIRDNAYWLEHHRVLENAPARSDAEVLRAIEYQLGERLRFVAPADPVVCDLFFEAARRVPVGDVRGRRAIYAVQSLRFGHWRKAEIAALGSG